MIIIIIIYIYIYINMDGNIHGIAGGDDGGGWISLDKPWISNGDHFMKKKWISGCALQVWEVQKCLDLDFGVGVVGLRAG